MSARPIEQVLSEHTEEWMAIRGVLGTGIGRCDDRPCIKIFVTQPTQELAATIPDHVDGYRVVLEPTGPIRALEPDE